MEMKLLLLVCCAAYALAEEWKASVLLKDPENATSMVIGTVTFTQRDGSPVTIKGQIRGLTPGKHGFHVHEKGDITAGCGSTGGHLNPGNKQHGAPNDTNRHLGDLGNIDAEPNGSANIDFTDHLISLSGENCIIGRAIVVHADPDDLGKGNQTDSLTTGHAGKRVACGVIGIQSPVTPWTNSSKPNSAPTMPARWAWPLAALVMHFIVDIL